MVLSLHPGLVLAKVPFSSLGHSIWGVPKKHPADAATIGGSCPSPGLSGEVGALSRPASPPLLANMRVRALEPRCTYPRVRGNNGGPLEAKPRDRGYKRRVQKRRAGPVP